MAGYRKKTYRKRMPQGRGRRFKSKANFATKRKKFTGRKRRAPAHTGSVITGRTTFPYHTVSPKIMVLNGKTDPDVTHYNHVTISKYSVKPSNILELQARRLMYSQFRITDVTWKFTKDQAKHQSGNIATHYYMTDHMTIVPNLNNEDLPVQGTAPGDLSSEELLHYVDQQSGSKKIKLNRMVGSIKVPARVVKNVEFQSVGTDAGISTEIAVNMPWMQLNTQVMDEMSIGQITVYQPALEIDTFFQTYPTTALQNGQPGQSLGFLKEAQAYEITCNVRWQVRGKHLDPVMGDTRATTGGKHFHCDGFEHVPLNKPVYFTPLEKPMDTTPAFSDWREKLTNHLQETEMEVDKITSGVNCLFVH